MIHNDDLQLSLKFSCPVNNKLIYFVDFIPIGFLLVKLRWKVDLRGLIEEHESWDRTLQNVGDALRQDDGAHALIRFRLAESVMI